MLKVRSFLIFAGGFVIGISGLFFLQQTLKPEPFTELAEGRYDSSARGAWQELLAAMDEAQATVYSEEAGKTELDRAEGLRFLTQLLRVSFEIFVEKGDPAYPEFTNWEKPDRKILGDNPDGYYLTAPLSGRYDYKITGDRGSTGYISFTVYGRGLNGWNRVAQSLSVNDLIVGDNGEIDIALSKERPEGTVNWIELDSDAHMIMVRQYFHDRNIEEPAVLTIRAVDVEGVPALTTERQMAERLARATIFFRELVDGAVVLSNMMAAQPNVSDPPKKFDARIRGIFYPTDDNTYYGGWYELEPGEVLVIEGETPVAPYWNVLLQNRWMQSFDGRYFRINLNDRQIEREPDGTFKVIVAHEDPGHPNWLQTSGHNQGLVAIRYQLATSAPKPDMRVITLEEARQEFSGQ